MQHLRRRLICSTGVIACGLIAACVTAPELSPPQGAATVPARDLKAGQYWEYAVHDAYTGLPRGVYRYTVARLDATQAVVDVIQDGVHVDAYVYAPGWNPIEQPLTNLQRFRYKPPFPAYEFPLYPGKTWRRIVRATDPITGKSYSVHVHARVGGWRRIHVPAGEFDALQVVRYVYAGNAEFFRLQEEITQTDWYAPSVGYVVVNEGNSSHIDTSRSGGGRGRPLRVRGDWLIAELVRYSGGSVELRAPQ
ncbi:MAG: hypothetical protein QOK44_1291 [Betaproteobacteria bacterium]|jgi:hypothetical protein|nr:hypothetical protein [Betaproteobacteria bacterium]